MADFVNPHKVVYNNTKITRLQTKFQVMIIMNVLFVMHWIASGMEMEMR
jgi:hypothetical protein